jgi:TRAP-type C4-dicarboxylate transport system substrate-binding protein
MRGFIKFLIASFLGLTAAIASAQQTYPQLNLRMAHFLTPNFPGAQIDKWFADEVEKRSGGRIKIQIFYAGVLGKPTELLDLVKSGAVELAAIGTSYYPNELPLAGIVQAVPNVYSSNEQAVRIAERLFAESEALRKELAANKLHPVFWHSLAGYRPLCKQRIEKVADFKGKRMRAWGEFVPKMWSALEATPVNVLPAELYESVQRGTLDCVFWAPDLLVAGKLYEVAKFVTDIHFGAFVNYPMMVNSDLWAKWPQSVRTLFNEVGREATQRDIDLVTRSANEAIDLMTQKHGVTVVTFAERQALDRALPDLAGQWVDSMKKRNLGNEAEQLIRSIRQMQAR